MRKDTECLASSRDLNVYKYLKGGCKENLSQALFSSAVTGQEAVDTRWNTGGSCALYGAVD